MMIKITELKQKKFRTKHNRDAYGNLVKERQEYIGYRKVATVSQGSRIGHYLIDCIIIIGIQVLLIVLSVQIIKGGSPDLAFSLASVLQILQLLLFPTYYFICEKYLQKTIGKYVTRTIVVDEYGNKPSSETILLRTIIRLIPFEPFSCLSDDGRGWHDKWSGTFVLPLSELALLKKLQEEQSAAMNQ